MTTFERLNKYKGREGAGFFRAMTFKEACALTYGAHLWMRSVWGGAVRVKVNGAVKRWKREPGRIEIPVKYGMYEYGREPDEDADTTTPT
jgi:hypothetical protein